MLEHIERLKAWQALDLPTGIERLVHQNRLLKIAREGGQMTPADWPNWGSRDFPSKNDKVLWRPRRPRPPEGYYFLALHIASHNKSIT